MIVLSSGSSGPPFVLAKQKSPVGVAYSVSDWQVQTPFVGSGQKISDKLKEGLQNYSAVGHV